MARSSLVRTCCAAVVLLGSTAVGVPAGLALATDTTWVPPTPAAVLAHARTSCRVDQFDELETTTGARFTDLSDTATRCVLTSISAPSYVPAEMAHKSPGTGRTTWSTGVVEWKHNPRGLVITIHVHSAPNTQETPNA